MDIGKREDETVANRFYNRQQDEVIIKTPDDICGQGIRQRYGVYVKAGTAVAILEVEAIDSVINSEIPEHKRHRAGGCNHILDVRFAPAKVHRQIIPDGKVYTISDDTVEHCRIDAEVVAACGDYYDRKHVLHCTQPDVIAKEMRRQAAKLSAQECSTKEQLQAQAIQDLNELLPHIIGESLMSTYHVDINDSQFWRPSRQRGGLVETAAGFRLCMVKEIEPCPCSIRPYNASSVHVIRTFGLDMTVRLKLLKF